jgi:hypothetical protein
LLAPIEMEGRLPHGQFRPAKLENRLRQGASFREKTASTLRQMRSKKGAAPDPSKCVRFDDQIMRPKKNQSAISKADRALSALFELDECRIGGKFERSD